ncbi:MAG: hypothetical protein QOF51_2271, partial [Chloroflexota bacterium]|nr:hypothetical protein [Chloroflexota bacterium]
DDFECLSSIEAQIADMQGAQPGT